MEKGNRPVLTAIQAEVASAVCKSRGVVRTAGESLHMVDSTVRYHLRAIKEATGVGYKTYEERKELKRLIGEYSKWLIS